MVKSTGWLRMYYTLLFLTCCLFDICATLYSFHCENCGSRFLRSVSTKLRGVASQRSLCFILLYFLDNSVAQRSFDARCSMLNIACHVTSAPFRIISDLRNAMNVLRYARLWALTGHEYCRLYSETRPEASLWTSSRHVLWKRILWQWRR